MQGPWPSFLLSVLLGCAVTPRTVDVPTPLPLLAIDHEEWDAALRAHVHDGGVDYEALCRAPALAVFVDQIARARPERHDPLPERLSFWINAYNALVIQEVCSGRTPETLLGRYAFFFRRPVRAGGEEMSLWDLEQRRILVLAEPRVHFALVCASTSCPRLRAEAYRPAVLDAQLDGDARGFVNDPSRNHFDGAARKARISRIFQWYEDDFAAAGSVAAYLARYVDDPDLARSLEGEAWSIRHLSYDWSLNAVAGAEDSK